VDGLHVVSTLRHRRQSHSIVIAMSMAYIFLEDWPSSSPSWTLRYVNKAGCSEATVVEVEEPQVAMEEEMAGWYVIR
jgi:hypothetical protein